MKKNFNYLHSPKNKHNSKFLVKGVILIAVMLLVAYFFRGSVERNIQEQLAPRTISEEKCKNAPTKEEIKQLAQEAVKEYIANNPEAIIQSLGKMQQRNQELHAQRIALAIKQNLNQVEDGKSYPSMGPDDAKVKIVNFYDYKCGYCHDMAKINQEIIHNNPDIQFIFRDFPILGEASEHLSRFALAVYEVNPELYAQVHFALLGAKKVSNEQLKLLAEQIGINYSDLTKVMTGEQVTKKLKATRSLAEKIGVLGTPAMVINGELIKGGISQEALQAKINQAK